MVDEYPVREPETALASRHGAPILAKSVSKKAVKKAVAAPAAVDATPKKAAPSAETTLNPDLPVTQVDSTPPIDYDDSEDTDHDRPVHEPRLWKDDGWTARVIKNEDDDGWAVEMTRDGESEPALVGPWTMGRDKKNPKPLDSSAFITLVKTAAEVIRRHEQQLHAQLHKNFKVTTDSATLLIKLDIVPDEDQPYALLSAYDEYGEELAQVTVAPNFKFTLGTASAWVENDFRKPG